ncbi:TPA: restriction endonuclease [Candidatus Bathyarchaeota archaeon]|nr:restriction endonuclease [Candidatus Bathyarchaeota archaeon]
MDLRNNFAGLTPREFERLIVDLFKEMGYKAELTPKTADYGADMVARKGGDTIVIEVCKYRVGHNVSNREVQSCGTVRSYTMRSSNRC